MRLRSFSKQRKCIYTSEITCLQKIEVTVRLSVLKKFSFLEWNYLWLIVDERIQFYSI